MKRAARKQVKKFGKGGLNRYASMMADKLKSPKMSPTERDRIQRAIDQGFTNIVYHSTDTPWDEIDLNYTDVGLHAGTPTQAANRALDKAIEAKLQERREQGQYIDTTNVLPLAYRPGKTLRMPDVGEFKDAYTTLLDMRTAPELRGQGWMHTLFDDVDLQKNAYPGKQSKDWLDSIENRMALAEIRQNLRDQGFRQIVYPNTHENAYGELTNLLPEYQDRLDQLSRDADALYQKSLSMRPQAPQPGATEQEIEAFLHPRDPLSYLDPEEAALYNKYRNEMERIEFSPGAYETGESIIFLDPADVRSVYARFAPEAAQETGLGKKQGGPVYDPSRINQMVDDLLDPMYEFEPYDDEAYEVQRFAKGGLPTPQRQWLKDAVENEVKRFQQTTAGGMDPQQALQQLQQSMQEADFQALPEGTRNAFQRSQEDLQRKAALNAWLGGTATKYIKRDYGTEQDPLTQLQMRHAEGEWPPRAAQGVLGRPPQVMGLYETTASRYTDPRAYGDSLRYNEEVLQSNPWLRNLPADQPIYRAVDVDALGMPHLVDEIQNAMNPSAGLPRNLQIRPESLQRMSFPQASELVGKINQYRAEQMAAANAQRATNPATQLVKQYPEGYRWVQITPDADIPEGWERLNSGDYKMPDGTITSRGWAERAVGDALKYEGDTMGHCVGGYCDSVMSGASRIYSLRDAQGMPHVTIEAVPEFHPEEADFNEYWNALKPRLREQGEIPDRNEWFDKYLESTSDFAEEAAKLLGNRQRIIQIKGKGNRAPVDQYVPFVQDFVRSQDWIDVQELNNARLRDATREFSGRPQPQQRYMTDAEYDDYLLQLLRDEQAPGMKEGGDVKTKSMLDELAEAVLAGSAGFGAQVTPDEYGNRGLVSATLSTPELLGLIPGGAQYIPAASGVASADYDEHLNNMLARYGLAESADLDTLDKFALAMGETVGQIPILPARGAAALKRFAPALFEARTIPGARAVDMVTRPVRAAAEYFSPTAEISPSMLAAATGIGGGLRTYFGNDPIAEPSNDADYDDLMQMLRRNAAIDLPSTKELTAKMPARPMRERMAYTPPSFPGMAEGGPVYDPARIESMVNELMEPQKLAKGGLPTPPKGPGKDVPRAETPDADYLTPAEREFLNRSVRTGMQVSERVPTSPKFTGDPFDPDLTIGVDVIRQSPEQMRKQAETMSQYINYPVTAPTDPESVFGLLGDQSVDNLLFLYDQMPADVRRLSSRWYEGANRIADEAATKYGIPIEGAAGVYASLSPQMDWFKNVSLGNRVMDIAKNYGDVRFTPEMLRRAEELIAMPGAGFNPETGAIVDRIKNSTLSELDTPQKKAIWLRLYDEAHNPRGYSIVDPLGNVIGPSMTGKGEEAKVGWGSLNEIAKALAIFEDPSMENINRRLGEMHKVRSFYNNIVNPYRGGSVTSDTHNVAAALMRPLSGSSPEVLHNLGAASSSNITGARGTYGLYADAVRRAAAERGITDPRAMQSITWEGIRGLYSPEMKRNKSLQERVADAVNQYRLGRVTGGEMREQLLDLGGGIDLPAWYVQ
jgi:chorismate mutase